MKKLLVLATLLATFAPTAFAKEFPDVPREHANYVAITELSNEGIINGNPDGTFNPSGPINKAAALTLILKSAGVKMEEKLQILNFLMLQ